MGNNKCQWRMEGSNPGLNHIKQGQTGSEPQGVEWGLKRQHRTTQGHMEPYGAYDATVAKPGQRDLNGAKRGQVW